MDTGLLLLRITIGLTLAAHGSQKLFGWFGGPGVEGMGRLLEGLGFRPGRRHALMAALVEFGGGLLLAIGLLTPLGSALIASVMLVALITVHLKSGFFAMQGGYEYALVLGLSALAVAFTGPGALSVDAVIGFSNGGVLWGLGAAGIALLGAASQLAQRQTAPPVPVAAGEPSNAVSH